MNKLKNDKVLMVVFFLGTFVLLCGLSYFPKCMVVYTDELRYLHIADGLFNYGHLMIRGTNAIFNKVMYPIALFPVAVFSGTEYFTQAVAVVNSFYMAFVPALAIVLARISSLSWKKTIFIAVLAVAFPDMLYTMTFMSENIYIPMGIAAIILVWKVLETREKKKFFALSVALGVVFYLLYLNKEIGVVLPLAYLIMGVYMHLRGDGKELPWQGLALTIGTFCVLFLAIKSIFFSGLGSSYASQVFFYKASMTESAVYFCKVFLIHLSRTILAFLVFPVVLPLAYWHALDKSVRYRYIFLTLCLLISLAVVSYTVTLFEDYPSLAPREHLRYVSYLFLPYVALSLQALALGQEKMKYSLLAVSVGVILATQLFLEKFNSGSHVDQMMLKYMSNEIRYWLIIAALAFVAGLFYRHGRKAVACLAVLMLSVSLVNQIKIQKDFRSIYQVSSEEMKACSNMLKDMEDIKKDTVCVASPFIFENSTKLLDSYPNSMSVVSYRTFCEVWKAFPEYEGNLSMSIFPHMKKTHDISMPHYVDFTPDNESARYLLVTPEAEKELDPARIRFVKTYDTGFALYENLEPTVVPFLLK